MTSKLVVNTIEADTGISSVSFASSISMNSTAKFHFSAAGIDIGADTNINRPAAGVLGFNVNGTEKVRIDTNGHIHGVGVVTATHFYGDGSNLTSLPAGNLTGTVADARISTLTASKLTGALPAISGANLTGISIPGGATNLDLLDSSGTGNGRIRIGASQDLQIYHDGSHSWFKNTTGRLLLQTDGDQIQLRGNSIIAFNGAASTEYLRISSNGNISINNSSGLSSTYSLFKHFSICNNLIFNAANSAGGFAGMQNNAYLNSSGNWVRVNNDHATSIGTDDGNFYFRNAGAGTGTISWNQVLTIPREGIVSMPNQPMVRTRGGWSNVDWNGYKQISWSGEDEDIGGNFSSGVFTVPSGGAGRYVMTAQFIGPSSSGFVLWSFFKNTTALNPWVQVYSTSTNTETGAGTVAVTCAVGDTLRIAWHGTYNSPYNGGYNSFSIYKVH